MHMYIYTYIYIYIYILQIICRQRDVPRAEFLKFPFIWRFPEMGVAANHPCYFGFCIRNHPAVGEPPFMDIPPLGVSLFPAFRLASASASASRFTSASTATLATFGAPRFGTPRGPRRLGVIGTTSWANCQVVKNGIPCSWVILKGSLIPELIVNQQGF